MLTYITTGLIHNLHRAQHFPMIPQPVESNSSPAIFYRTSNKKYDSCTNNFNKLLRTVYLIKMIRQESCFVIVMTFDNKFLYTTF